MERKLMLTVDVPENTEINYFRKQVLEAIQSRLYLFNSGVCDFQPVKVVSLKTLKITPAKDVPDDRDRKQKNPNQAIKKRRRYPVRHERFPSYKDSVLPRVFGLGKRGKGSDSHSNDVHPGR